MDKITKGTKTEQWTEKSQRKTKEIETVKTV
jgi:hypothetical protein